MGEIIDKNIIYGTDQIIKRTIRFILWLEANSFSFERINELANIVW